MQFPKHKRPHQLPEFSVLSSMFVLGKGKVQGFFMGGVRPVKCWSFSPLRPRVLLSFQKICSHQTHQATFLGFPGP